ncbi:MAG TPA: phosphoribosyltransferase family protein [Nitrososphaeraceae archaeon]|nr:phosphoribosyltransferase family protein [Nitrososphaeraceae archaeon]
MIFELISRKFQFKFKDRVAAADILGESLKDRVKKEEEQKTAVVLGIPRGGVITADIVAKKLSTLFFDIIIPRKLTDPDNKEQAIGAIMEDGTAYIEQQLINDLQISTEYLEKEKLEQIQEIKRRSALYLNNGLTRKDFSSSSFLKDKTVILVDDGAATGATIIAAAKWIKKLESKPKRLIIAIPVAPKSTVNLVRKECNAEVEVVISPSSSFHSVEQYHQNFQPIPDEQVIKIMKDRNLLPPYSTPPS